MSKVIYDVPVESWVAVLPPDFPIKLEIKAAYFLKLFPKPMWRLKIYLINKDSRSLIFCREYSTKRSAFRGACRFCHLDKIKFVFDDQ